mgnify:CR=1 FL=1
MAENDARRLPPPPVPEPQDLDDMIFRWESDVPTVSDR